MTSSADLYDSYQHQLLINTSALCSFLVSLCSTSVIQCHLRGCQHRQPLQRGESCWAIGESESMTRAMQRQTCLVSEGAQLPLGGGHICLCSFHAQLHCLQLLLQILMLLSHCPCTHLQCGLLALGSGNLLHQFSSMQLMADGAPRSLNSSICTTCAMLFMSS